MYSRKRKSPASPLATSESDAKHLHIQVTPENAANPVSGQSAMVPPGPELLRQAANLNLGDFLSPQDMLNIRHAGKDFKKCFEYEDFFKKQIKMDQRIAALPARCTMSLNNFHADKPIVQNMILFSLQRRPDINLKVTGDWSYIELESFINKARTHNIPLRLSAELSRMHTLFCQLFNCRDLRHPSGGYTVLHLSVVCKSLANLYCFLEENVDVNSIELESQHTALHLAARSGSIEFVRILVGWPGCNINQENYFGQTALDLTVEGFHIERNNPARVNQYREIGVFLEEHGASEGSNTNANF